MLQNRCQSVSFSIFLDLWNKSQNLQTPNVHSRIATWLQKCWARGDQRLILQAFRACGKSTLAAIFSAWVLYRDPDSRILVLAAESRLSNKMVRQIRKLIERHPLTKHLIPKNPDEWAADSFTISRTIVSRDPSVLGRGLFSNITGTRADFIICDDVEVPNTCDTVDKRVKLRERLLENEFILTPGGRQIYIGTPHSYYSIYAKVPRKEIGEENVFLKSYRRLSVPILDGAGNSAWPEKYSVSDIEQMRIRSGPMKFASQMMLEPTNIIDGRLDPALLQRYDHALDYNEAQQEMILSIAGKKIVSASAWWDPAFASAKGDASVVAVVYSSEDGSYHLHRMEYIRVKAGEGEDEASLQCQHVAKMAQELYLPSIAIETNGIGQFLPAILRKELAKIHVPCAVVAKHSARAKDERILESFDAVMAARALYVHASVYQTRFIKEMQEWRPGAKGAKDDGLDAAAGALSLEPVRMRRSYSALKRTWRSQQGHIAKTNFDVLT
jgi:hypothetical protein